MSDRSDYIYEYDGVRAFSILFVLAAHLLPLGPGVLALNEMAAVLGMSLFFGLSGFLITSFLYKFPDRIGAFFIRRVARIYPVLVLYAFIVAVLIYGRWDSFWSTITFQLNYDDDMILPGISHLWSICVEFHFYVFIGLAVWAFGRRGLVVVPIMMVLVLFLRIDAGAHVNIRTLLRVDEIFAGGLVALLWLNREHPRLSGLRRVIGKGFWLWIVLLLLASHEIGGGLMYFRPFFAFLTLYSLLEHQEGPVRRFLRIGVLAYIAKISYALYIWHGMYRLGWLGERGSVWVFYLLKRPLAILLSFASAHVSTFTIEKYFIGLGKRLEGRFLNKNTKVKGPANT